MRDFISAHVTPSTTRPVNGYAVFAGIEIDTLREQFSKAQDSPERIPAELKPLIALPDCPEKLVNTLEKAAA